MKKFTKISWVLHWLRFSFTELLWRRFSVFISENWLLKFRFLEPKLVIIFLKNIQIKQLMVVLIDFCTIITQIKRFLVKWQLLNGWVIEEMIECKKMMKFIKITHSLSPVNAKKLYIFRKGFYSTTTWWKKFCNSIFYFWAREILICLVLQFFTSSWNLLSRAGHFSITIIYWKY